MKGKWGVKRKKRSSKNLGKWSKKTRVDGKKYQMIHAKRR